MLVQHEHRVSRLDIILKFQDTPALEDTEVVVTSSPIRHPPRFILVLKPDHFGDLLLVSTALNLLRRDFPDSVIIGFVGGWNVLSAKGMGVFDIVETVDFFGESGGRVQAPNRAAQEVNRKLLAHGISAVDIAIDFRLDWDTRTLLSEINAGLFAGFGPRSLFPFLDIALPFSNPTLLNRPFALQYLLKKRRFSGRHFWELAPTLTPNAASKSRRPSLPGLTTKYLRILRYFPRKLRNSLGSLSRQADFLLRLPQEFETYGSVELISSQPVRPDGVLWREFGTKHRAPIESQAVQLDNSGCIWRLITPESTLGHPSALIIKPTLEDKSRLDLVIKRSRSTDGPHQEDAHVALAAVISSNLKNSKLVRRTSLADAAN